MWNLRFYYGENDGHVLHGMERKPCCDLHLPTSRKVMEVDSKNAKDLICFRNQTLEMQISIKSALLRNGNSDQTSIPLNIPIQQICTRWHGWGPCPLKSKSWNNICYFHVITPWSSLPLFAEAWKENVSGYRFATSFSFSGYWSLFMWACFLLSRN